MKIQLTLEEIWALQDVQRTTKMDSSDLRSDLIDAGLIYEYYLGGKVREWRYDLTQLGKITLEKNLPVIIADHSSLLPIIRPIRLKPKLKR